MNICLVGCGGISRCHLAAINSMKDDGAKLIAVCDIIPERAENTAKEFDCKAYTDYDEMIKNEAADVIHICTPHYLHVDMAVKALERNINVVLEKPCATSYEELKRLENAADNSSAQIAVCFQNRYNPSTVFIKKLIDEKTYGDIYSSRAFLSWKRDADYYDADEWRGTKEKECGGVLINQAIHTFDLLTYLVGKETYSIDAKASNFHLKNEIEVEDTVSAFLKFKDGTRSVFYATTAAGVNSKPLVDINYPDKVTLRLEGDCVYLIKSDEYQLLFSEKEQKADTIGKKEWGNSHCRLIADFYDCIKTGRHFEIDAYKAGRAIYDLLAVYESSEKDETIFL